MIDYAKIDQEYDKIHKRLSELEERYQITPQLLAPIEPIDVAAGLPLHIRCFLIHRAQQLFGLKIEIMADANKMAYTFSYYDPYELPMICRRITISFDEIAALWKTSGISMEGFIKSDLPTLAEVYLKKEGYLTLP